MLYFKLTGHNFEYEVLDIAVLFFERKDILFTNETNFIPKETIFIESIQSENDQEIRLEAFLIEDQTKLYSLDILVTKHEINTLANEHEKKTLLKRTLKRQIYFLLSQFTKKTLPWGILTGIRPVKIVHDLQSTGISNKQIKQKLQEYYYVSEDKSSLAIEVASNEKMILQSSKENQISIYIGIPFCKTRCLYCSFTSNSIDKFQSIIPEYLRAIDKEMEAVSRLIQQYGLSIQTIYIGGGTPSSLHESDLQYLIDSIERNFYREAIEEYTFEAGRPDTLNKKKFDILKNSRITRICINPQTMNDFTLKLIGRNHTHEDIFRSFQLARDTGFDNINMDIIAGLPKESLEDFITTLERIKILAPEGLTIHSLAFKRASKLNEDSCNYKMTDYKSISLMIRKAHEYAKSLTMLPYYLYRQKNSPGNLENVGFCKAGFASIYNVQIMEETQTIFAIGAGAITKIVDINKNRIERTFNVKEVAQYIFRINEMIKRKHNKFYEIWGNP